MAKWSLCGALVLAVFCSRTVGAQDAPSSTSSPPEPENKRIFGIIPNNRTFPDVKDYRALTVHQKWVIVKDDSLDRGTFLLGAAFGGEAMFFDSSPSFGRGLQGYARYMAASYADWTLGNVLTEGLYPSVLHQDPRYFRRGIGSGWSRLRYAMAQILWTHADSGAIQFNYSEVAGNSTAVAISNLYYADNRRFASGLSKVAVQIGVDMAANILKEFSPDWTGGHSRDRRSATAAANP